jgi:nucleoside-diphosphate-sugar epimerase
VRPRILVTGASGKIGRHMVAELLSRGYQVRALTTKSAPADVNQPAGLEWWQFDWSRSLSFGPLVAGCAGVLHLGAELHRLERMQRSNIDAVRALVAASEAAGVKFFCYFSSVAVYGSPIDATVTEDSPLLTHDRDVKSEYFAEDYLRYYGRTKLGGERVIYGEAKKVSYVILRPTVVVDIPDLLEIGSWSSVKKAMTGYRHSHQIYVLDVVHATLWFMERHLESDSYDPAVGVYNLSNDDFVGNSYGQFFREAFRYSADSRFKTVQLPSIFDRTRDVMKFRLPPVRHSLGTIYFSPEKLYATGYRHRYGMAEAHQRAFDVLAGRTGVSSSR